MPARIRDSMTMEILEGRNRQSEEQEQQTRSEVDQEVDVSRWDLPDHLVSQPESDRESPPTGPGRASRPTFVDQQSVRPSSRPFPLVRPGSVYSVPIPHPAGPEGDTDDYGVVSALESVERVRRLVDGGYDEWQDRDRERVRTRSGGDLGLRDRRTARVSFSDLDVYDRPSTSMGLMPTSPRSALSSRPSMDRASRSSFGPTPNPVLVPLPTSPARSRQSSSYLPPIANTADTGASADDVGDVGEGAEAFSPNPFAMPAPPPQLGSRFDPKQLETQRSQSSLSRPPPERSSYHQSRSSVVIDQHNTAPPHRHTLNLRPGEEQDITESLLEPHSSRQTMEESRSQPPKVYEEIPSFEEYGKPLMPARYSTNRPQRLSRHDLLRPKTLVMPHSLANIPPPPSPPKKKWEIAPDGFEIGAEKPLPAGARTSVLTIGGVAKIPLSLSQRTFRASLLVDGEGRDSAWVGGADEEGQVGVGKKERDEMDEEVLERRPGKLYVGSPCSVIDELKAKPTQGKSLMDQLEARKQAMKGQQR